MSNRPTPERRDEQFWREFLEKGGDSVPALMRRTLKHLPDDPRCRMCAAPFAGPAAPVMRLMGRRPSDANPNWCTACFNMMAKYHGGAEISGAMLFADIRGSTALGERLSSADFHALLDRYYATATRTVFDHDGFVDKFVGDELVALFFRLLSGDNYVARAIETARSLLLAVGHADPDGPWAPLGAGVHAGRAWFGVIGDGTHVEMTAVGDAVNIAARLAAAAGPGEILVSVEAAAAGNLDPSLERRTLDLKGKALATEVVVLRVGPTPAIAGAVEGPDSAE